jgi:Na+-driven multidrug efflux pump
LAYLYRFQPELLFFPIWRLATQAKLQCILSLQLAANSTLWALGSLVFFGILAREGVSSLAALALLAPLESISLSFLIGLSSAASILIGTSLGRGEKLRAEQEAWQAFYFSVFMGLITALLLYLAKQQILQIFGQIDPEIMDDVWMLFDWMALCFILRGGAMMLLAGILRAGGDNSFCLALDFSVQWLMLIPCAWILREWLHWPVTWLYGLIVIEEGAKIILALLRLKSGRWLHTLLVEG